jgi:hypothetical protein
MMTDVPSRLSSTNRRSRRLPMTGSTLPVGLVGEQQFGTADHGACDGRTLLLAA